MRPGSGAYGFDWANSKEHVIIHLATIDNPREYNDKVIFPDKVRINRYYLHNYSFWTDIKIIFATVLGRRMEYGGEEI